MSDQLKDKVASHNAFSDVFYTIEVILDSGSFILCFSYDRSSNERKRVKIRDYHNEKDVSFDDFFERISENKKEEVFNEARKIENTL